MCYKQKHPKQTKRNKQYSRDALLLAYNAVKNDNIPTERAARLYGVPAQTLRDRVLGRVHINSSKGKNPLFSHEEEESLVKHLEELAKIGYGLNRSQLNILATEMAVKLGKIDEGKSLSDKWYYAFLKRWDNHLKVIKPRSLSSTRASCLTQEAIKSYFTDLDVVLEENSLKSKPHLIYNLDETGLQLEHRPSKVIAGKLSSKIQAVTSPNSSTTTLIACINAAGTALPPFYIFKGKLRNDDLIKDAAPNSAYEMSDSGWSNGQILMKYLKTHFLTYIQRGSNNDPVLLIFDGHASHVNLELMKWALEHKIILFVLPPHASHALQPLDVGCFAPFKACYYSECNLMMAKERGRVINRYDIAALSGKAYLKSMTPSNIIASFKKCGISPFNGNVVPKELLLPSQSFQNKRKIEEVSSKTMEELLSQKIIETGPKFESPKTKTCACKCKPKKPRLGGKCITQELVKEIEEFNSSKHQSLKTKKKVQAKSMSPKPSTSGQCNTLSSNVRKKLDFEVDSDSEIDDDGERCCACNSFSPPGLSQCNEIIIVKWAECTKCGHWCHLRFCSSIRVVRRHADFFCPHCS